MAFVAGQELLHYRLTEKIGEGGMGVVWKAEDSKLRREVALKTMPAAMAADPLRRARFERESQAIAALNHPNIVTIYSVESAGGVSFIAMELIDGQPLGDAIPVGGFPLDQFLEIAVPMTSALSAAHDKGITHRDIKPDNMMLTAGGHLKVLDFGLAKVTDAGSAADPSSGATRTQVTEEGKILGTVAYMSPEQAEGKVVDPRSDVFSLGIVLYQMATGTTPFQGDTPISTITSIMRDEPQSIGELKPALPRELGRIVNRCLSKDPKQRYATATELHQELMQLRSMGGAQPAIGSGANWKKIGVGVLGALLVVAAAAWFWPKADAPGGAAADEVQASIAVLPLTSVGSAEESLSFGSGIHNDLIIRLSKIRSMKVISRTSVMEYQNTTKSMRQIADELGVATVVEGSVQLSGDRVRLTVQLVNAATDESLWAESYDRELNVGSIFDIQADVTGQIARALRATLTADEQRQVEARPTENLEAYEAYLRGLEFIDRSEQRSSRLAALEMFELAVEFDPQFAEGYAALGRVHTNLYWVHDDRTPERLAKALKAIETAERLSPGLPEATLARGFYYYWGFLDYDRALAEFAIAEESLPNSPMVAAGMGYVKRRQGKMEEAVAYFRRAAELDPLNQAAHNVPFTLNFLGRHEEAERETRRLIQREPTNPTIRADLGRTFLQARGDVAGACAVLKEAADLDLSDPELNRFAFLPTLIVGCEPELTRRFLNTIAPNALALNDQYSYWPRQMVEAWLHKGAGDSAAERASLDEARVVLEAAVRERPEDARIPSALGQVYAGLGRKDDAIREGLRGVELLPYEKEALRGAHRLFDLAGIYAAVGEPELAIDRLEFLLERPTSVSVPWLRVDPLWDPIREHPQFQALVAE
jgi:serine/threonine protein kinase/Flp pilus assembly protein TadD